MPNHKIDLTGRRFRRLMVLSESPKRWRKNVQWICRCNCGAQVTVPGNRLRYGQTQSCGCLLHEGGKKTHGLSQHPLYNVWHGMMNRCHKPTDWYYDRYGGRGIFVCKRWHNVKNFIADLSDDYRPGLMLERKDNNKGYMPSNCRWATPGEQANNKSNNRTLTALGKTQTLAQWSRETGIHRRTITSRLDLMKWPPDRAVSRKER